jgi:trimeric autotransporter adhesin
MKHPIILKLRFCALLNYCTFLAILILLDFAPGTAFGQIFTPGNLTVLKVGDGSGALSSAAWPISVVEYTTSGAPTGVSVNFPSSGLLKITNSGSATSEGMMGLSAERDLLVVAGYDAPSGTAAIASTSSATYNRELFGVTSGSGYSKLASSGTAYSGNNIRSGTSSVANYFGAGPTNGVELLNTSTQITTAVVNMRVVQIFNGQTYFSSSSGTYLGVSALGTGIPTTSGTPATFITSPTAGSAYGFSISPDGNTLYIADDAAGIKKYTLSGGIFTLSYVVNSINARGLTVDYSAVQPVLYATTTATSANTIIKIIDGGPGSAYTTIATAPANTVFRGITFSPSCYVTISLAGASVICAGDSSSITFTGNPTGVVTYNVNGGAPLTKTIGSNGVVTFNTGGLATTSTFNLVSITTPLCSAVPLTGSVTVTVNPLPAPIAGTTNVCVGSTITLTDASVGGSWSSSSPGIATIGTGTGIVTGISPGVVTITYTLPTGCFITVPVTVNAAPSSILGVTSTCVGSTTVLSDAIIGGTWASSNPAVATVGLGTGIVTGVSLGTTTITYTLGTGCFTTTTVSVGAAVAAISGLTSVCVGSTITLSDATPGGTWSSGNLLIATVGSGSGIVTGMSAGAVNISYTLGSGCSATYALTVLPLPTGIAGVPSVCVGATTTLTDVGGGIWSSSNLGVATIGSSTGVVNGVAPGTSTITYTLGTGCTTTIVVTANPLPAVITGFSNLCIGATITLADVTSGGTWSSSTPAVATIGSGSGIVTGVSPGTTVISYVLGTSCTSVKSITVNPLPTLFSITGGGSFCAGGTGVHIGLSGSITGVNYQLYNGASPVGGPIAGTGSALDFGLLLVAGTYTVTGTIVTTGCNTSMSGSATIVINPLPAAITGPSSVCVGSTMFLADVTPGGTWTTLSPSASVFPGTGLVTGITAGTAVITYTIGTGCFVTKSITVNPVPVISGPTAVCPLATIALTAIPAGGIWVSSTPSVATIGSTTGIVTGVTPGTTVITYTLPTGCTSTMTVTVSLAPTVISGPATVCTGFTSTLTDGVPGGVWTSSAPAIATIGSSSGIIMGIVPGNTTITYSLGSGCSVTKVMTVIPSPAPITGTPNVCVGNTTFLTDITPGGTWTSATPAVGTISGGGIVTGISAGTTIISYMVGGCPSLATVTVNPLPSAIGGVLSVCLGQTTTLSNGAPGGTWSITPITIATIGSLSGIVTGVNTGTAVVTYTLSTGCIKTTSITVNPLPAPIIGSGTLCQGTTTTLTDVTPGGSWTSAAPVVATISGAGLVSGLTPGTAVISYTLSTTGCAITKTLTVTPQPSPILGTASVCVGQTIVLSDTVTGGTWTSSNPAIADIGSTSGVVAGNTVGTTTITYSVGGCSVVTKMVTVTASPAPITGPLSVCIGSTILKNDISPGGIWSSGDPTIASIGSTGIVSGISSGTVIITYTLGISGCKSISPVVVNPVSPIYGMLVVCQGQTTVLGDTTLGGTWTSSAPSVATVAPITGVVTGISGGISTITYTLPTGCTATVIVTVNPLPAPIVGVPQVCVGHSINLTDATPGGIWSSSNTLVAAIGTTGVVSGISPGTSIISYTLGTGCANTVIVTVNDLPAAISGPTVVCVGGTILLSDAVSGGAWSTSNPAIATIGTSTGLVTGVTIGSVIIHYTLGTGCNAAIVVNVDSMPGGITGVMNLCVGSTTSLSDAPSGGTWSSGNTAVATIGSSSGIVSGISNGIALISYSLGTGCTVTADVTVNSLPLGISGASNVCVGATTLFTDMTPGGVWTSSDPSTAIVGSSSGIVTGASAGLATITYSLGTGCTAVRNISVNPLPAPIAGILTTCLGASTFLSDATPFGTWSSSNPALAPVSPTGVVSGIGLGVVTISYTAGCTITAQVTVNPFPTAITGIKNVCVGANTVLHDSVLGGIWTSSDLAIATIGSLTGVVAGVSAGVVTITYNAGAGCSITTNVTVNPLPSPIFGPTQVCETQIITLLDAQPGGIWTSGNIGLATIDSFTGQLTGVSAGVVTISYTIACSASYLVTVNPIPSPISGSGNVCLGGTVTLHDAVAGGTWWSTNTAVATVGSVSGIVNGVALGTSTISYILPAGCSVAKIVNVYPLPVVFFVSGGGSYCSGGLGVHIYLSGSTVGVNYMLYRGVTATGSFAGTGSPIDFGLQTVGGTYTVIGTSTATTCSSVMADSAVVIVSPSFIPTVNILVNPGDTVCAGTLVTFTPVPVNGGITPTYLWNVNGFPVAFSTTYAFIPADGDVVGVTMTSSIACPAPSTANHAVKMNVLPYMSPSVSISPSPGDTVCAGTSVTLTPVTLYGGHAPVYTWMKNGDVAGSGAAYTWIPDDRDIVYCIMHSDYPCQTKSIDTSADLLITVDTPVAPRVFISALPGTTIAPGQSWTLTAIVSGGTTNLTYQWFKNGLIIPAATAATYTSNSFSYPKPDSVTCMVTTNGICTITGFGWTYVNVENVGVKTVSQQGAIRVFPNPNSGEFTIIGFLHSGTDEKVSVEITNVLGQVVYTNNIEAKGGKLDEKIITNNEIANGMYILSVRTSIESRIVHLAIER